MDQNHIRNFSIIAHVDHGKSTLADRFIQICGGLTEREMEEPGARFHGSGARAGHHHQGAERDAGLQARDGRLYKLNFIDTPGHVDFSYEVSRSLAACEGALAGGGCGPGRRSAKRANCYTAVELGLEVIPVLNKIDLPSAEPERVKQEIEDIIGIEAADALASAPRPGRHDEVLEALVQEFPAQTVIPMRRSRPDR